MNRRKKQEQSLYEAGSNNFSVSADKRQWEHNFIKIDPNKFTEFKIIYLGKKRILYLLASWISVQNYALFFRFKYILSSFIVLTIGVISNFCLILFIISVFFNI